MRLMIKFLQRLLAALFAVLILAAIVLYLIPLNSYIPAAEKLLTEQLHETVNIQQLKLAPLPLPHLALLGVHVGSKPGVSLQSIKAELDMLDLLSGKLAIRSIVLQDGTASFAQIQKLIATLTNAPATSSSVAVHEVQLSGINLTMPKMSFGPIEGKIELDEAGKPQQLWFAMNEKKISVTILPLPEQRFSVLVNAHAWTVPQFPKILLGNLKLQGQMDSGASTKGKNAFQFSGDAHISHLQLRVASKAKRPLEFDEINTHIVFRAAQLDFSKLEAKSYGGGLTGSATLNFDKSSLIADASVYEVAMQPLVQAFSNELLFSGDLNGTVHLGVPLNSHGQFLGGLQLESQLSLRNGAIGKVDLVQAANILGKNTGKDAATGFDSLTGLLNIDACGYHFRDMKLASGVLNASGKIDIAPDSQLSGALDANIKNTVGLVSVPMVVTGTASAPVVRPTKSSMAGAAVGTAILGPGLGTAAGIKVGGFLNTLFGKNDEKSGGQTDPPQPPAKK